MATDWVAFRERVKVMERAHLQQCIDLIDAYLNSLPPDVLIAALERVVETRDATVLALAEQYSEEVVLGMRKERWLTERWIEKSQELDQLQNTHQHLIEATFVKTAAGRSDVRPVDGEHGCQANSDHGSEFGYCDAPAVAQVLSGGVWRFICHEHLGRLPPAPDRRKG